LSVVPKVMRAFLEELGRRRVVRVAVMYAGAVFVLLEAADIILPALGLPESAVRYVVLFSLLGFPVVLVAAWVFDLTPRGVVITKPREAAPEHSPTSAQGIWLRTVLLLLTFVVVGWGAVMAMRWASTGGASGVGDAKSIAVLPFEDMNQTDETAFFTAGIHEDILSQLARIGDLRVISRTSVMQYRDTNKTIREIAAELGVGTVLEGSVRQDEDRVRVVTQLIDARTDDHLWSETYDREKKDIFQVQSEIAQEIAGALQATLSPEERGRLSLAPTDNLEAYDYYLQGRVHSDRRENRDDALRAVELYEAAVALDPEFAAAHAALSRARMWLFWNWSGYDREPLRAMESLDRALVLAPDAVESRLAQGFFHFYGHGDYDQALQHFSAAAELRPSDAEAREAIGLSQRRQGRWLEAIGSLRQALELDPRSYRLSFVLGQTRRRMRAFEEAERYFERAISIAPDLPAAHRERFLARLGAAGDTVGARRLLEESEGVLDPALRGELHSFLALYRGDLEGALDLLRTHTPSDFEAIGVLNHLLGRPQVAAAFGDSLLQATEALLSETQRSPGLVQTRVVAEAHARLGMAHVLLGHASEAVKQGTRAVASLPTSVDAFAGTEHLVTLATIYTLLGEHQSALEQLEVLLAMPSSLTVQDLRHSPLFDSLRGHPRFEQLLTGVSGS
jgi:TolB-like protein/Tfp pilus assembly protein PilF